MLALAWIGLITVSVIAGILAGIYVGSIIAEGKDDVFIASFYAIFGPVSLIVGYIIWYLVIRNHFNLLKLIWIPIC